MGAKGHVTPTERLRGALRDRRWTEEELVWVLGLPVEQAQHLVREPRITPTLALRLEAALEISATDWYAAAGMPMPDLWLLQDQMAGELAAVRRRRYRLTHDRRDEAAWAPRT
jgi:plasmid maintenance system antidote protein VapI